MSDINVNFTISQFNANLSIDPAPNVSMSVQDPMTAQFYIEGTTGNVAPGGLPGSVQYNIANSTFGGVSNFTYSANSNIYGITYSNVFAVNEVVVGDISPNFTVITSSNNQSALKLYGSISALGNVPGGQLWLSGGDGSDGGAVLINGGQGANSGSIQLTTYTGGTSSGDIVLNTPGKTWTFASNGELKLSGFAGDSGYVLTSQGSGTGPLWAPLAVGNVANINLNGNVNQVLSGTGTWIAQSGGGGGNLNNVTNAYEVVTLHTTTTGTYNYDILNSSVSYSTANAAANITINFRGNSTTTLASQVSAGKSVTAVYLMTTGATGYIPSTIQIDGVTSTVRYAANITPVVIANTICSYTFTMIKISDSPITWTVLGSQTRYG